MANPYPSGPYPDMSDVSQMKADAPSFHGEGGEDAEVVPIAPPAASAPAATASEPKLPEGVEKKVDDKGRTFYVDHFLKSTSWEAPRALPTGWERKLDAAKGKVFYINHNAKKTQWEPPTEADYAAASGQLAAAPAKVEEVKAEVKIIKPASSASAPITPNAAAGAAEEKLPGGWEKKPDPKSGKIVYIDHYEKKTSWTAPAPLPEGWERKIDDKNRIFYIDHINKKTQWEAPVAAAAAAAVPAAAADNLAPAKAGATLNRSFNKSGGPSQPLAAIVNAIPPAASEEKAKSIPSTPKSVSAEEKLAASELPGGYEKKVDDKGRTFYVDHYLKTTSWEAPQPLPSGWERKIDDKNRVFYIDHVNKKTQWEPPVAAPAAAAALAIPAAAPERVSSSRSPSPVAPIPAAAGEASDLPKGYEKNTAADGRVYYVDHFTKTTSWDAPKPLPAGWERELNAVTGKVQYLNTLTQEKTEVYPLAPAQAKPAAPATPQLKLPEGFEAKIDSSSGKTYYVDHFLKFSLWDPPKGIPMDWQRAFDASTGRIYYIDHTNKRSQFEHPLG